MNKEELERKRSKSLEFIAQGFKNLIDKFEGGINSYKIFEQYSRIYTLDNVDNRKRYNESLGDLNLRINYEYDFCKSFYEYTKEYEVNNNV